MKTSPGPLKINSTNTWPAAQAAFWPSFWQRTKPRRAAGVRPLTVACAAAPWLTAPATARAGGALKVCVLIPGSKSDKGWMESGYDDLKRAEKKQGDKVKVTFVENVKFADMEQ